MVAQMCEWPSRSSHMGRSRLPAGACFCRRFSPWAIVSKWTLGRQPPTGACRRHAVALMCSAGASR
eukprot:6980224-Alexandrium_andersonii.AAC.1